MKVNIIKAYIFYMGWAIIIIAPFLGSCATDEKFAYTNDLINSANKRITSLEETVGKSIDEKFSNITTNQADIRIEIDQLKEDISQLSGRVEENEYLVKHSLEKDLTSLDTLRIDLADLSSRLSKLETSVIQQQRYLDFEPIESDSSIQGGPEEGVESGEGAEVSQELDEQYIYDSSLAQYKNEQYNEALSSFESFLEQYPKSDLADNAQFWIGECYMELGEYEQAILAYEDVINKYPKGNKVPNAMLRQGIAFLEMNDKDSATIFLQRLIEKYPDSSEAKVAQKKLDTMK